MAPLLEFRAGRSYRVAETNQVMSAPDRGLVYLEEDDGLLHFYYKDLGTSTVTEDLIIFPGDASFQPANKQHRVSVLKFNSSSARHFFWHQDPNLSEEEFEQRGKRVNELIGGEELPAEAEGEDAGMEVEAATPAAPTSGTPAATRGGPPPVSGQQALQLENILSAFRAASGSGKSTTAATSGGGGGGEMQALQAALRGAGSGSGPEYTLPDVLPTSALTSLISSLPDSSLSHLSSFLPPTLPTSSPATQRASLVRALTSPEFRRSTQSLDRALRTGATGPVLRSLGMDRGEEGVEEFLGEIARAAKKEDEDGAGGTREETRAKEDGDGTAGRDEMQE